MKRFLLPWLVASFAGWLGAAPVRLFDGSTFGGWEGATNTVWKVRDGALVGGSLSGNPRNEFLATTRPHANFRLRLEYRLVGTEGFVNGGVQFRSQRVANPPNEVSGFQADIGAGFSGCLYDESRRNRVLVMADTNLVARIEKPGDWNVYEIEAIGRQVVLTLNGHRTAVWIEQDASIARTGIIALQIHGGSKAEISYRNLEIEDLPEPGVPPEGEILGRFGGGQPRWPIGAFAGGRFGLGRDETVVFVGGENLVRDQKAGEIEAVLAVGFRDERPRFRSMAWEADTVHEQWRDLNFGSWAPQLERAGATVVVAQFGQMEALDGVARLPEFVAGYHRLLDQFASRTRRWVLVSPMPFERPEAPDAPDLTQRNGDVAAYAAAVRGVAERRGAVYVDLFGPLSARPAGSPRLTGDGIHLLPSGLREVARVVGVQLGVPGHEGVAMDALRAAIVEKNRLWYDCWRPANWSFAYGDRVSQPFGKGVGGEPSLKEALERHRPLIEAVEGRIHALAAGKVAAEAPVAGGTASPAPAAAAMTPEEEAATFAPREGFQVNLFASERDGVVKPTQMAWDERGRLYVACSPTYPQTRASSPPMDYIVRLEDTDGDGKADRSVRFAEGLTMVQGVEPGDGGVYVCDFDQIVHLRDTDGDGKADERRVVMSGFGVGDTHQLVNSISHGPDGSLWFSQGLHAFSRVETPWGVSRLDRAAVWRWRPRTLRLEGFFGGGMAGANCWGVAFDDYGQVFHKSGDRPHGYWTVPGMVRGASPSGGGSATSADASYGNSPEQYHPLGALFDSAVKTTSIDIVGTRAMPDDLQGCAVIGGYFGAVLETHRLEDAGAGFRSSQQPKLLVSSTPSFRPVDVSVGPDGAIYAADWFNPVIGHYQASYADPRRDRTHGRIWRVTAKGKATVKAPDLASMDPSALLDQLRSPERWVRQQAKRLLSDAPRAAVVAAADRWVAGLGPDTAETGRWLVDVTGVYESHETARPALLARLLASGDARVRAYGARVAGAWADRIPDAAAILGRAARDANPRVRLESVVAATYLPGERGVEVTMRALESARDPFLDYAIRQSARAMQPRWGPALAAGRLELGAVGGQAEYLRKLEGAPRVAAHPGQGIYEMACLPCHQPGGKGLAGVYPPLEGSEWVRGEPDRLVRIVLHGLAGPLRVAGRDFGVGDAVPMPAMEGLSDAQIADVLSYVRHAFGGNAAAVDASLVARTRAETVQRTTPWTPAELGMKP